MDEKIKVLLDKINMDESSYPYFSDAKLVKIKINSKKDSWQVFIEKDDLLPIDIYEELESKKHQLDEKSSNIDIIMTIKNQDLNLYLDYYKVLLKQLKKKLKVLEIYENCMQIEDNYLVLVVSNEAEKEKLENCQKEIDSFYKRLGYPFNIEIVVRHEENVLEEIQKELENVEVPLPVVGGVTWIQFPLHDALHAVQEIFHVLIVVIPQSQSIGLISENKSGYLFYSDSVGKLRAAGQGKRHSSSYPQNVMRGLTCRKQKVLILHRASS